MLCLLHIENIAVIEQADISFDAGFNVLTGETGAGKSIVIDAINAVLGQRTYRDVIRTGAAKAFVSAIFSQIPKTDWFEAFHVPYGDELLIQREIYADGRNVCRVNGSIVTVGVLKQLGDHLIQIHGQHDSQQLFDEQAHLACLDAYAAQPELMQDYRRQYHAYCEINAQIKRLSMDESECLRRVEMLRHQIGEIERARVKPGELAALLERRTVLQNAERISGAMENAAADLYGDETHDGAEALLNRAAGELNSLSGFDPSYEALGARASELMYQVQDLARDVRAARDGLVYSDDELEQLELRLADLQRLARKYGPEERQILDYLERAKQELDEIAFADDRIRQLKLELQTRREALYQAAKALHEGRIAAAKSMANQICAQLRQLDMPRVRFVCQFDAVEPNETGMDAVRFLMSANAGEALKPLSRVASGGELARIMLAIKNVMAQKDTVPTLIFDEVDAGVSGRAAQRVAEKLSSVAKTKQVLCVTHLPQIAAMADTHLEVSKAERDRRTYTTVRKLDFDGRRAELARLIGGAQITQTTLSSAEEMLRH